MREIRKEENREFTIIYYRRYLSMIENHILNILFNDLLSQSSEFSTAKTAQLFSKHFPPGLSLSLCILYSFFIKARILLQILNQVFTMLYMFSPFSFVFINAVITSTQAKISVQTSFFPETCVSSYFYFHDASELPVSL